MRRLLHAGMPKDEDLIRACYGSEDFHTGAGCRVEKRTPQWRGC